MRRRDFIKVIAGSATAWPLAAWAQPAKLPTIAILGDSASAWSPWTAAFVQRLRKSAGLKVRPSPSNIVGRKDVPTAWLLLQWSSYDRPWMLLSLMVAQSPL
jgi:hypothetical protein